MRNGTARCARHMHTEQPVAHRHGVSCIVAVTQVTVGLVSSQQSAGVASANFNGSTRISELQGPLRNGTTRCACHIRTEQSVALRHDVLCIVAVTQVTVGVVSSRRTLLPPTTDSPNTKCATDSAPTFWNVHLHREREGVRCSGQPPDLSVHAATAAGNSGGFWQGWARV